MYDVVVVGAGPAGSAAALAARAVAPGASVLLLDRAAFPRDKACGDGVAPHALHVLADLGVHGVVEGFAPVRRLQLGYAGSPGVTGMMREPAYVIPREVLDDRLARAAVSAGADLRQHRVREVVVEEDRVVLDGEVTARVVVAADGANSGLRRQLGIPGQRETSVAVAIRGYAPVRPGAVEEQVIAFGSGGWPAYAWSFPIGDGRANVGYGEVQRPGRRLQRDRLLARVDELLPGAAVGATAWRAHKLPLSTGRPRQPDGRVLLAGDAASLINPLTGEGIYYAVLSGALAGRAAVIAGDGHDAGQRYRDALRRELGRHLRHTSAAASLARNRPVVEFALRRAEADPRVFDGLVELGLGRGLLTPGMVAKGLLPRLPRATR